MGKWKLVDTIPPKHLEVQEDESLSSAGSQGHPGLSWPEGRAWGYTYGKFIWSRFVSGIYSHPCSLAEDTFKYKGNWEIDICPGRKENMDLKRS